MNKKSLFHISKRDTLPWYTNVAIRGGAIILALVVCALVTTILTGENPLSIYGTILKGAFGTARKSWTTWENVAILLGISLAVTPAFKMRFWNIGAEGQVLIGCLASTTCMICLGGKMPNWLLLVVMTVASLAAGALWGFLPGFFKAKWNTNETLFTLMMNYIATQLVAYFIIIWEVPKGSGKIGIINQDTQAGWLPTIGNQKYLLAILVVAILTGLMYIYLNYSKHGYEIAVVGESRRTASYAGIKVDRVIIRTMALSGALCGLIGLLLTSSTDHTMTTTIVDGRGFTAVMVSWMAKFNPIMMIFTSLLIVVLSRGASEISSVFSLNHSFADILTGIILFFIIVLILIVFVVIIIIFILVIVVLFKIILIFIRIVLVCVVIIFPIFVIIFVLFVFIRIFVICFLFVFEVIYKIILFVLISFELFTRFFLNNCTTSF